MNDDLKKILEQKVAEKTAGTFHLGRGQDAQRILFDGTLFQFYSEPTAQHFPMSVTGPMCWHRSNSTRCWLSGTPKVAI